MKKRPLADRFWEKVDVRGPDECWPWLACVDDDGYGRITGLNAHRVCWELCFGPIPVGFLVCHSCDFRACCNPRCLFLGTVYDNNRDRDTKGRQAKGETINHAKLTRDQIKKIRNSKKSPEEIAAEYGISQSNVSSILLRKTWK